MTNTSPGVAERAGVAPSSPRPALQLFLLSLLALYAELLCIRLIPAYVRFVGYFSNFILLASFLGLGVGILSARRTSGLRLGLRAFPWLLLGVIALVALTRFELRIESAGVLYYGASEEGPASQENAFVLPAAFLLVALLFACLGRPLGLLLTQVTPPLRAYAVDIAGSLAGITGFFLLSLTEQPPAVWLGALAVLVSALVALSRPRWVDLPLTIAPLLGAVVIGHTIGSGYWWSPYYRVGLTPVVEHPGSWVLTVNNVGHQMLLPAGAREPFYRAPYEIFGRGTFKRALIIGAGSGSDVAIALQNAVEHVDAVEIDPVIQRLGIEYHPDQPYRDPRVSVHIDDGRSFLRRTDQRYDLIVFALPDSLTLTSQFASLRLESFLFTTESFREARDRLDEGGVLVLYNYYRETWLLRKLAAMLEEVFGTPPYVMSYGGWGRAAVLVNGPRLASFVADQPALLRTYEEGQTVLRQLEEDPDAVMLPVIGTGLLRSGVRIEGETPAGGDPLWSVAATDDWPLMYLPARGVPAVYLSGLAMVAACALVLVFGLGSRDAVRGFNGHMFFLGAAFMLLETKSLVSFSLLFGSTWLVNSLVFFAILSSVLLAVFVSARLPAKPPVALFGLLLLSLLGAYLLPADTLLAIRDTPVRYGLASAIAFLPVFVANLVFAGAFRLTGRAADVAFASNLLGAMAGGMLEYTALALGYRHLLLLALAFYAISALLLHRRRLAAFLLPPAGRLRPHTLRLAPRASLPDPSVTSDRVP
jgi:hypothetical protein